MPKPTQPLDQPNAASQPDQKPLAADGRDQLQMLHEWVQLAPQAMALLKFPTGTILTANSVMSELLGWTLEEMCGRTTKELGLLVDTEQRQQIINRARANPQPMSFELQISNHSGQLLDTRAWLRYTLLQGKEYLLISLFNKTEIKRTEEALRISQEKFSLAFHMSPDPMVITDKTSGCLLEVNNNFERRFGWKANEVIGRSAFDLGLWVNPQDRIQLIQGINKQTSSLVEALARSRDGSITLNQVYADEYMLNGSPTLVLTIHDISQQREQELALRDSEERLNLALESARQGFWDWKIDSGEFFASARTANLHGLASEPLSDKIENIMQSLGPEARRAIFKNYKLMLTATEQHFTFTYQLNLPVSGICYLETMAHLQRDEQGHPLRLVGVVLDISEKVLHEQQLKASEEKFTSLFHASIEACCVGLPESGVLLEINQQFTDTFGWTPEEVIGKPPTEYAFWTGAERIEEVRKTLMRQGVIRNYPMRFRHKLGHTLQCLCSSRILQVGGDILVTTSIQDISARLKAEAALQVSQEKFAKAFNISPNGISIIDLNSTRYLEINEGFTRISGYTASEVIGKSYRDIGIWSSPEQVSQLYEIFFRDGRVRNQEVSGHRKNGSPLTLSVSIEPFELNGAPCILTTSHDISELKNAEARIQHMAYHDPLTNLPNRILLTDRLTQQIPLFKRHNMRGALLYIDIDRFKTINDSLGHAAGDSVLKIVATRLQNAVRAEDTAARLGGDEFVVLLSAIEGDQATANQDALTLAEKLRALLAEPMLFDGHQLHVTPSIGIAMIPDHGENPADLLKHADIALYRAKDAGRNAIKLFQLSMLEQVNERLRLENDLRQALLRKEFKLHYQPQVDARNGRIIGAEALLRWDHPTLGLQLPAQFIHVLEESGQIVSVGFWILAEACRTCAALLKDQLVTPEHFSLAVNVSAEQFSQPGFTEGIFRILEQTGVPACMLKLEVTESIIIKDMESTIVKMQQLQAGGVNFAMDDFGTGYSSLTYLKRLPVSVLKIDQSFIQDVTRTPSDAEIIRAIIGMAQSLKLDIIAEGVEAQEQLDFLTREGCYIYQGYLFSKPVAFTEFRQLLVK